MPGEPATPSLEPDPAPSAAAANTGVTAIASQKAADAEAIDAILDGLLPTPAETVTETESVKVTEPSTEIADTIADGSGNANAGAQVESQAAETMQRVQSFLGELKSALVELAQRQPTQPAPLDVGPLVQAVQMCFERSAEQVAATHSALTALTERVGGIGQQVEHGVAHAMASVRTEPPTAVKDVTAREIIVTRRDRQPVVLMAVAALIIAWSVLFWFKTGSPRLALGTLVGANLVGCCLLSFRRS
jgi:hypothetical protein